MKEEEGVLNTITSKPLIKQLKKKLNNTVKTSLKILNNVRLPIPQENMY